jgi:hypothetical protein
MSCSPSRRVTLCTTQALVLDNLELHLILLLALPTGGPCTVSAVNAAAAHHPRLDRAQIMSAFLEQVLTAFNHVRCWKVLRNYIRGSSTIPFDLPELIIDLLPDLRHFPPPSTSSHLSEELEPSIPQRLDTISSSYCSSLPTKDACDSWEWSTVRHVIVVSLVL